MTEKNESNRRRKWAPKARTGCRTCKTRHVKCDETKPVCRRCILSGFRCDGYLLIPSKRENDKSPTSDESADSPESATTDTQSSLSLVVAKHETPDSSVESPGPLTPSVYHPTEPYVGSERQSLTFFINMTAAMVSRSRVAPHFWQTLVPRAAWMYPSVRHALLATAISCESLFKRDSSPGAQQTDLRVLTHTSKAMRSLLNNNVPMDVVLLTSATLGILDLFNGSWDTACTHVSFGARLAKQARTENSNDPYISFYCEAFASALPTILKRAETSSQVCPQEENSVVRLKEAVESLNLAVMSFDDAMPKVEKYQGDAKDRILTVLRNAKTETEWILQRWEILLQQEMDTADLHTQDSQVNLHRVESPWSAVMTDLDRHLQANGDFDVNKFEVAMERTMPFFTLAKSGPNVKMREDAVELMYLGCQMRGRIPAPQRQRRDVPSQDDAS